MFICLFILSACLMIVSIHSIWLYVIWISSNGDIFALSNFFENWSCRKGKHTKLLFPLTYSVIPKAYCSPVFLLTRLQATRNWVHSESRRNKIVISLLRKLDYSLLSFYPALPLPCWLFLTCTNSHITCKLFIFLSLFFPLLLTHSHNEWIDWIASSTIHS